MRSDAIRKNGTLRSGQLEVILAALAFGMSVPAGKILLADVTPLALSGILYLSAGTLCALLVSLSRWGSRAGTESNTVRGREWFWLGGAVLCGAVVAPLLLFVGLRQVSGYVAGLLLNFETVFTVGLGVLMSGEYLGRRGWLGAAGVFAGAIALSLPGRAATPGPSQVAGVFLVISACALWGLDNNLTQRVSLRDARQIVAVKGIVGGLTSLSLAAAFGGFGDWNALRILSAMAIGAVSFGLSIALFVRGLRQLGVLQTGILFALAPAFAAILSWLLLREPISAWSVAALVGMTAGALLLVTDRHEHLHTHEAFEHSHPHDHDEHHQHDHTPEQLAQVVHAHHHRHATLVHGHSHAHDVHHRHGH